ncbi:MAG: hypothetical protein MJZ39_00720 [Bacteroidales bacterium]|nr:hypothetical protein [Bacteroidales bacterium]
MNISFDYYNVDSLYYVYPDRLGSYTHITNSSKQVVRALHFDPWGNVKSDADNFVQAPEFTQSYNRYSYCLNNPLQYVDPSGESFIAAAFAIGTLTNVFFQMITGNINSASDFLSSAFIGGFAGVISGIAGNAALSSLCVGGFIGGAASGAVSGAAAGAITGFGNAFLSSHDLGMSIGYGFLGGAMGALSGGLVGGLVQGLSDYRNGFNFWNGSDFIEQELGIAAPEDKMLYYQRMAESYNSCSYLSENDEILRNRVCDVFDVDFDWNISKFTTSIDKRYGLTENGIYVNLETKGLVKGYVKRFPREVHISYHYVKSPDLESQKGYFGWYPSQYRIPFPFINLN